MRDATYGPWPLLFPLVLLAPLTLSIGGCAGDAAVERDLNAPYLSPDLDVDEFIDRFEGESREVFKSRSAILAALRLSFGTDVADVGAGTGLFTLPMARAVGDEGHVYAVDIAPNFVARLGARVEAEGLRNVTPVLCTETSAHLPPASVDVVFICDTYHHFSDPPKTLASLHRALRPGGTMVVVDFERIPGKTREWLLDHVRAGKEVFRAEIEAAGFTLAEEVDVEGLEENYCLRFVRP